MGAACKTVHNKVLSSAHPQVRRSRDLRASVEAEAEEWKGEQREVLEHRSAAEAEAARVEARQHAEARAVLQVRESDDGVFSTTTRPPCSLPKVARVVQAQVGTLTGMLEQLQAQVF